MTFGVRRLFPLWSSSSSEIPAFLTTGNTATTRGNRDRAERLRANLVCFSPNQRHKPAAFQQGDFGLAILFADQLEFLAGRLTYRNDHASALCQLVEERGRHFRGRGRDEDCVVWSVLRPSFPPVAYLQMHVVIGEPLEYRSRRPGEGRKPLNGKHFGSENREQRCDITGTGSYLQHAIRRQEAKVLQHSRYDVRLRNGLLFADGKRMVFVGVGAQGLWDEFVARDGGHGGEDALIMDSASGELGADHAFAVRSLRWVAKEHLLTDFGFAAGQEALTARTWSFTEEPHKRGLLAQYGPMIPPIWRLTGGFGRDFFSSTSRYLYAEPVLNRTTLSCSHSKPLARNF